MRRAWIPALAVCAGVFSVSVHLALGAAVMSDLTASAPISAPAAPQASDSPADEPDGRRPIDTVEDPDLGPLDVYWVDEAGDLDPAPFHGSAEERIWDVFLRVAGREFAAEVVLEYLVGSERDADLLAFVAREDDPRYWMVAVNLAWIERGDELVPTLIHEYAHILTLQLGQVDPDVRPCPTLSIWEGCAAEHSALWAFQQRFWAHYDDAPTPRNVDWDVADEFYARYPDHFVSDYAAMNVVEDIAESFMVFVLEDRPAGRSEADEKIAFFYDYPEFVEIRDRIRTEFAGELGFAP